MRARSAAAVSGVAALMLGLVAGPALAAASGGTTSVTMCHRTRSVTNPYRQITVSQSSVTGNNGAGGGNGSGHSGHTGPVFDATPGYYATHAKDWGDVIPPFGNYRGLNTDGALLGAPLCGAMSAEQFYNLQREAGVPRDTVIADLVEQGAAGDPAPEQLAVLVYTGHDATLVADDQAATGGGSTVPDGEPTPGATASPTPTPTVTASPEPEPTVAPTVEPTVEPTPEPTTVPSPVASPAPTAGPTDDATESPTPTATSTPTPTPTPSRTATSAPTPAAAPSPAPSAAAGTQRITGVVWLDRDRNGVQDGLGEPGLPQVTVELYRVDLVGGGGATGRVGAAVAAATSTLVARVTTSATGSFAFGSLAPGAYSVQVRYPQALAVTWDSEGVADASAAVLVPESGEAQAQVGLAGDARADLEVRTSGGAPVDGTVLLWWAGPDGVFGTPDDLQVPVTAVGGRVTATGLPTGSYRSVGPDGDASSSAVTLTAAGTRRTVTLAAAAPGRNLAATGSAAGAVATSATWLVLGGLALTWVSLRRRVAHD